MDKAIFEFEKEKYEYEDVYNISREMCEKLCNKDEDNVTKYNIETDDDVANILNSELCTYYHYRVFLF